MVPATGSADLYDMYGELLGGGVEAGDLLGRAGRTRYLAECVTEHPGNQSDLLFSADRTHRRRRASVKFRGTQQIRTRVAHIGHGTPARVDLREPGLALQSVVDDLALHGFQRTWSAHASPRYGPATGGFGGDDFRAPTPDPHPFGAATGRPYRRPTTQHVEPMWT